MSRVQRVALWGMAAVAVVVGGAWGAARFLDIETRTLDDAARAAASGRFVRLTDGITHYEIAGPAVAPVVVLAAGSSVPGYIWDPTFAALSDEGFRVVRYDYFGRGFSDRPEIPYSQSMYVRQLAELLDLLEITRPVALAGLSYGGTVITSFAAAHPERVASLIYVDPAISTPSAVPFARRIPILRELVLESMAEEWATGQLDDFLHPERFPDWVARYRVQMSYKGFRAGRLSDRLANQDFDQRSQLAEVGKHPRPVLVLWGKQDRTVPIGESAALLAALPRARFVIIDASGHLPQWEQPELTHRAMLEFLRSP
jgi:pimeloyl-ACP methyl ester carboxylesterase